MINKKIAIIDYGLGNIFSLHKALECFTKNIIVTTDKEAILSSDAVIMPGVGAFAAGMNGLIEKNLIDTIIKFSLTGKPMMGICLGAQLLLSKGYEFGEYDGLGIIPGKVQLFSDRVSEIEKIPHIGWNGIHTPAIDRWNNTIFENLKNDSNVYFVHSYVMSPKNMEDVFSLTEYGGVEFCSAIKKGNIYGFQFHPEKSGEIGLAILKEFINIK